jgi:3-dehydroquinate synthase
MSRLVQKFSVYYAYHVIFTRNAFGEGNSALDEVLSVSQNGRARALAVIDSEVARLTPGLIERVSRFGARQSPALELVGAPLIIRGGEICKREPAEVAQIHAAVERYGLCRHSFIVAIGGGAVLDAAGYAAATAHRGIRLVRMPTTVLAQNDAGVGVKNGINAFGRKNFLGTFAPPFAVVNDFDFLNTLAPRDMRAGMAEAVKVALIRDRAFFDSLYADREALAALASEPLERLIVRCAELHLEHIRDSKDPFESGSSRPLDFGHWAGHKLEELTLGGLRHGEAVAIGMALDSLYSNEQGLLCELDLHRILTLLERLGFALYHEALLQLDVQGALREFQEHLGGDLSIPLLAGIGRSVESHQIDTEMMKHCITVLADRAAARGVIDHEQSRQTFTDAVGARGAERGVSRGAR